MHKKFESLLAEGRALRAARAFDEARVCFWDALADARTSGDPADLARALIGVGQIERDLGRLDIARASYEQALTLLHTLGDERWLAHTIRHVGDIVYQTGDPAAARPYFEQALTIYRAIETPPLELANALRGYALALEEAEERSAALAAWGEAHDLYERAGVPAGTSESGARIASLGATR